MEIKNGLQKVLHFPLTKIVIGMVVLLGIVALGQWLTILVLDQTTIEKTGRGLILGIVTATVSLLSYGLLFRYYEQRTVSELSTVGLGKNLLTGIMLGGILQSLTILVIYVNGGFSICQSHLVSDPTFNYGLYVSHL